MPTGAFRYRFIDARTTWNNVNTELRYAYNTTDNRMTVDYESLGWPYEDKLAITILNAVPYDIHHAEIAFNTRYADAFYTGTSSTVPPAMYDLEHLALHELSHTIELQHTNNPVHITYEFIPQGGPPKRSLSQHDINGINAMYGAEWGC